MKLNIDCIRTILLECENIPYNSYLPFTQLVSALNTMYSEDEIAYNCLKLKEADYLSVVTKSDHPGIKIVRINDITFSGHEFLNNVRSSKVAEATKNICSKIGVTSLQAFTQIATGVVTALIKAELGL